MIPQGWLVFSGGGIVSFLKDATRDEALAFVGKHPHNWVKHSETGEEIGR